MSSSMVTHIDFDIKVDFMISKSRVAKVLKISTITLDRWIKAGKFPQPLYIGTMPRWVVRHVNNWLNEQKVKL